MAYIGKQPVVGNFVKLDAITTSATATYNLLNGGVAYFPQTANNCIVSLNGVIQSPTSAYTISGSTIVFSDALTASDSIDFILVLGDVLAIGTPSDSTVGFAKVTSNLITGATAETSIAGGDSILIYDDSATALRKMTRTNFVSGLGAAAGQVIQVVSTTKSDTFTMSSTTFADVTSLSVSITPSSTSSKILILYSLMGQTNPNNASFIMRLLRDSTAIGVGDSAGSREQGTTIRISGFNTNNGTGTQAGSFLDSPNTTSALSYKIQVRSDGAGNSMFVNRGETDTDNINFSRGISTITVMEIKG